MDLTHKKKYKYKYFILEFQGPTGPQILAPAVVWLATLTFGLASFTFGLASLNLIKLRGDVHTNERTKIRWGCTYKQTN